MLARIAQELFWLGRDMTRAEHTARMLDGAFHADVAGGAGGANSRGLAISWRGVLAVIGAKPPVPGQEQAGDEAGAWVPTLFTLSRGEIAPMLTLDTENPAAVVSCIYRARERARTLRDVISTEMWEALNGFYLSLGRYDLEAALATGPYSVYQEVKERCALFWGVLEKTMLRDEARSFLEAGGRIEEADMVLRMLRIAVPAASLPDSTLDGSTAHEAEALALLQAVGGFQAFRRSVHQVPDLPSVGSFLLYESTYPGSVVAALASLQHALETADQAPRSSSPVLRLGRLIADLELQQRTQQPTASLIELLAGVQDELGLIDHDIDERYFTIAGIAPVHI